MRRHRLECTGGTQGTDVVDDVGAEIERGAHHLGLGGIDRDRATEAKRLAQHRQHPRQFGLEIYRVGARTARLAAEVEDVGALGQQPLAGRERPGRGERRVAVGERVGREVDDAHHPRLGEIDLEAAGLPGLHGNEKRGRSPVVDTKVSPVTPPRARCPESRAARRPRAWPEPASSPWADAAAGLP